MITAVVYLSCTTLIVMRGQDHISILPSICCWLLDSFFC
uniref:Uncharacterized protein n=1 Tax=Zea mays TaxID=4577 RepID=B4FJ89_MAIZE|nr:unknown [Zea mays]